MFLSTSFLQNPDQYPAEPIQFESGYKTLLPPCHYFRPALPPPPPNLQHTVSPYDVHTHCCGSGSGAFLTLGSGIRDGKIRIRDGKNSDPGWKKFRSGINIPYPQHCTFFLTVLFYTLYIPITKSGASEVPDMNPHVRVLDPTLMDGLTVRYLHNKVAHKAWRAHTAVHARLLVV